MNKKGFTLLELLVVVLIIGILAGIALPQYRKVVDKARFATMIDITRAIAEANERYYLVHDQYSANFNELDIGIPANSVSGNRAYFGWGSCFVGPLETACINNTSLQAMYIKGNNFSSRANWNSTYCLAEIDNTRNNNLCRNLGGELIIDEISCNFGKCKVYRI